MLGGLPTGRSASSRSYRNVLCVMTAALRISSRTPAKVKQDCPSVEEEKDEVRCFIETPFKHGKAPRTYVH